MESGVETELEEESCHYRYRLRRVVVDELPEPVVEVARSDAVPF